jgi:hypothetical protein
MMVRANVARRTTPINALYVSLKSRLPIFKAYVLSTGKIENKIGCKKRSKPGRLMVKDN